MYAYATKNYWRVEYNQQIQARKGVREIQIPWPLLKKHRKIFYDFHNFLPSSSTRKKHEVQL